MITERGSREAKEIKTYCSICGKPLVKDKPHFIPLGDDTVLKIVDETCEDCGGAYINENQQTTFIKNKAAYDKLIEFMETRFKRQQEQKPAAR